MPSLDAKAQARLRSQSGAHAGDHLTALPKCEWTIATPLRMNGMLRRRARLPIATGNRQDVFGDYGAAWPRDGRLRRRGAAVERAFRPLWTESTVQASEHPLVRELVPTVPASDGRQADVFICGMSIGSCSPWSETCAWAAHCTRTAHRTRTQRRLMAWRSIASRGSSLRVWGCLENG